MANPTTNYGWVMPVAADLVTNLPAQFNTFGQGVDTSMAQLIGGTTGQYLAKTSATSMAFTWTTLGAWAAYTPTFVNFTLGNGTITKSRYVQVGKRVVYDVLVTLGTTSSMGTSPTISLPVTGANTNTAVTHEGSGTIGAAFYVMSWRLNSTTAAVLLRNYASTDVQLLSTSATFPGTWASGNTFSGQIVYEAA